jgi:hypothetical protein
MAVRDPRQQHIVPAFYLSGFTDTGRPGGKLYVFDYLRNKHYRSSPRQVCKERDYYRIFEPENDSFALERSMAELESGLALTLREVTRQGKFQIEGRWVPFFLWLR